MPTTKILLEAFKSMVQAPDTDTLARIVSKTARTLMGANGASFIFFENGICSFIGEDGIHPFWNDKHPKQYNSLFNWMTQNNKPVAISDIYKEERFNTDFFKVTSIKSLAVVQVDQSVPSVAIAVYWEKEHFTSTEDIGLLQSLADSASAVIEKIGIISKNNNTIDQLRTQNEGILLKVGELKNRLEKELFESNSRYFTTLYSIGDGVISTDLAGDVVFMNAVAERLTGWPQKEAKGKPLTQIFRIINQLTRKPLKNPVEKVLQTGKVVGLANHTALISKDGREFIISDSGSPIKNENGEITGTVLVFKDDTEAHQIAEKIKSFNRIFEESLNEIYIFDATSLQFVFVNKGALKNLGYNLNDILKITPVDIKPEFDKPKFIKAIKPLIDDKVDSLVFETIHIRKDGTTYPVEVHLQKSTFEGKEVFVAIILDITERKKQESRILKSESDLKKVQHITHIGSWYLNVETNEVTWTEELYKMYGFDPSLPPPPYTEHMKLFTPESWDKLSKSLENTSKTGIPYELELQTVKKDGKNGWMWVRGEAVIDKSGKTIALWGAAQDISERKNIEAELQKAKKIAEENEIRFRALHNASFGGIAIHDKGIILDCNLGLSELSGYTVDELIGMDGLLLISEKTRDLVKSNIAAGYEKDYEAVGLRKNGEEFPIRLEARNIPYKGKQVRVVEFRDITEQKKANFKIEESEVRYRTLVSNSPLVSFVLNPEGIFTLSEGKGLEKLGVKPGEVVGLSALEIFKDFPVILNDIKKSLSGEISRSETVLPGVVFDALYTPVFDDNGKLIEVIGVANEITARKEYEMLIERHESELEDFFENDISASYLVNVEGEILSCNRTFIEMFGFKEKAQAENTNIVNLYRNPYDRKKLVDIIKEKGKVDNLEIDFISLDGTIINNIINAIGIFDENGVLIKIRGYVVDITKRKIAEKELLKLSHAIEQSPLSIVTTNTKGDIEFVNPGFTRITGYSAAELIGKNPRILKSGETSPETYKKLWETITAGKIWYGEFHNRKKNGELYWESATIAPIFNEKKEITIFIGIKEDISKQKELIQELIKAKERAEESDRLKSAFLANMSHEIRTPMNGILGFTELLLEPDLSSEEKEVYINIVHQSGQRMLNTVNDLVEISKIEAGIVTINIKEVDVDEQIKELILFFTPEATNKGLKLAFVNSVPGKTDKIKTDQNKLNSILTNLIKNAIKYTKSGEINVGTEIKGKYLEIYVNDTGIGIPEDQQKAVFDRFVQVDATSTKQFEGSGLGLAIAKAYVEMLGGKIYLKSKSGEGSTFYFTLPIESV